MMLPNYPAPPIRIRYVKMTMTHTITVWQPAPVDVPLGPLASEMFEALKAKALKGEYDDDPDMHQFSVLAEVVDLSPSQLSNQDRNT